MHLHNAVVTELKWFKISTRGVVPLPPLWPPPLHPCLFWGGGAAGSREPRPSMSPAETHFISPSAYGDIHLYFSWRAHKDSDKWILFIKTEEGMQKNCKDSAYRQRREVWGCKGDVEACEFITSSYLSNFLNWRGDCTFSPLPPPANFWIFSYYPHLQRALVKLE